MNEKDDDVYVHILKAYRPTSRMVRILIEDLPPGEEAEDINDDNEETLKAPPEDQNEE